MDALGRAGREPRGRGAEQRVIEWIRRHERALIACWLVGASCLLVFLALWGILFGGADRTVDAWNARWPAQVDDCAELLEQGQWAEAARRLERLDARFPARNVKHRYDMQRERLLGLLAQSYQQSDRKRRCLETHKRRVEFDPRNWQNHFDRAQARAHFADSDGALDSFAAVTAIHPTHLPTLQAVVGLHFDGAAFGQVVAAYEAYLDAWLLAPITLRFGERSVEVELFIDGFEHTIETALSLEAGWSGQFCIESRGYSLRFHALDLIAPVRVGQETRPDITPVRPLDGRIFDLIDMTEVEQQEALPNGSLFTARGNASRLCTTVTAPANGSARLRIQLSGYKALDPATWSKIEQSCANLLAQDRLSIARGRTCLGGVPEAGSIFAD